MVASFPKRQRSALDRVVVAFSAAAREDQFSRLAADQRGNLSSCSRKSPFGDNPVWMTARGVSEALIEVGRHCFGNIPSDRRSGVVIQIDRIHVTNLPNPEVWAIALSLLEGIAKGFMNYSTLHPVEQPGQTRFLVNARTSSYSRTGIRIRGTQVGLP